MKVLHVITGLNTGGAQMMLYRLLSRLVADGVEGEVISLDTAGPLVEPIRALGVKVTCLDLVDGPSALLAVPGLGHRIRRACPDIVHCWMYHANLLGGLAARVFAGRPVIWGLRLSTLDPHHSKRSTIAVARIGAALSRLVPAAVVCVSRSARDVHVNMGYDRRRMVVIENGFDLDLFRPDAGNRALMRRDLGFGDDDVLIGLAARFDPQKDLATFFAAARDVAAREPRARFLICGETMDANNTELVRLAAGAGLSERTHLLGCRTDMDSVTGGFDIAVSSSAYGEGFSNALAEAMCCAVPAVATDVGDARQIVGDAGRIVPPRDPGALADALCDLITMGPEARAPRC